MKKTTISPLIDVVIDTILTDNLQRIQDLETLLAEYKEDDFVEALKLFAKGRYSIEVSWDYERTYKFYKQAIELLSRLIQKLLDGIDKNLCLWLKYVAEGHLFLQKGESAWTFCSFENSYNLYKKSIEEFRDSTAFLKDSPDPRFSKLETYSEAWGKLAEGLTQDMLGYQAIRTGRIEDGGSYFSKAEKALDIAVKKFSDIGNQLGIRDCKSYVTDYHIWAGKDQLYARKINASWMDFAFFPTKVSFEKILAYFSDAKTKRPSELAVHPKYSKDFEIIYVDLGQLEIKTKIDDGIMPPLNVGLYFLLDYAIMIEYSTEIKAKKDIYSLHLLKLLNSGAVPTYDMAFSPKEESIKLRDYNGRLTDFSGELLNELLSLVKEKGELKLLDNYTIINIAEFSEESLEMRDLVTKYPYYNSLFSRSEMAAWDFSLGDVGVVANAAEGLLDGIFHISTNMAVFLSSNASEWEAEMYMEALEHLLVLKNIMAKSERELEDKTKEIKDRLGIMKSLIQRKKAVGHSDITDSMLRNIEIRLFSLQVTDLCNRLNVLKNRGMGTVSIFVDRAANELGISFLTSQLELLLEKMERLYETIYSLNQEYLSLLISINSDISTRAFSILNIIMLGSLGLSVLTATLQTPIELSLASLGIFVTSLLGYIYLRYVKYKVSRIYP